LQVAVGYSMQSSGGWYSRDHRLRFRTIHFMCHRKGYCAPATILCSLS